MKSKSKNVQSFATAKICIALIAVIGFILPLTGCEEPDSSPDPVTLSGIAVTVQPEKTVYAIDETLDTTSMVVTATYSDETKKAVTEYTISPATFTTAGDEIEVTVTYGSKTATFNVKVTALAPFTAAPVLTLAADDAKLTYTWAASNPAADSYDVYWIAGSGKTAAEVKAGTKITGASIGGDITGLTNDTAYSVLVTANKRG